MSERLTKFLASDDTDEFLKFDRVKDKLSTRPDLHAFLLLNFLVEDNNDIVGGAEHDQIYLDIDCEKLERIASAEQLTDLCRCGVIYDPQMESLYMLA